MAKPSQSGYKRFFYNQNIKRAKSKKKYKNLLEHAIMLIKRIDASGMDAWLSNAVVFAKNKISRYGIASYQLSGMLESKGLQHLNKHVDLFYV